MGNNKIVELGAKAIYLKDIMEEGIPLEELFEVEEGRKSIQDNIEQISIYNLSDNSKADNRLSVMEEESEAEKSY